MEVEFSPDSDRIEILNTPKNSDRLSTLDPRHDFHFCIENDKSDVKGKKLVQFRADFERCLEKSFTHRKSFIKSTWCYARITTFFLGNLVVENS